MNWDAAVRVASHPAAVAFAAVWMLVLVWKLIAILRDPRVIRRALGQAGYAAARLEPRFLTKGPFREMPGLSGMRNADRVFRFAGSDPSGVPVVAWVRVFRRWPWQPLRWNVQVDPHPERTRAGVGLAGFIAVLLGAGAAVLLVFFLLVRHQS